MDRLNERRSARRLHAALLEQIGNLLGCVVSVAALHECAVSSVGDLRAKNPAGMTGILTSNSALSQGPAYCPLVFGCSSSSASASRLMAAMDASSA
jgi:hypothetical protein